MAEMVPMPEISRRWQWGIGVALACMASLVVLVDDHTIPAPAWQLLATVTGGLITYLTVSRTESQKAESQAVLEREKVERQAKADARTRLNQSIQDLYTAAAEAEFRASHLIRNRNAYRFRLSKVNPRSPEEYDQEEVDYQLGADVLIAEIGTWYGRMRLMSLQIGDDEVAESLNVLGEAIDQIIENKDSIEWVVALESLRVSDTRLQNRLLTLMHTDSEPKWTPET